MTTPLIDAGFRERADKTLACIHCGGRAAVETYDHHRHDGSWRVEIVRCYLPNRKAKGAEPCPETKTETRMETTFEMPKSNVSKPMITPSEEHIQFARDLSCTHARIREVALVSNSSLYRWMGGKAVSLDVHNRILKALGQLKAAEVATNAGVAPISGTVRSDFAENHLAPETLPEGSKKGEERAEVERLKADLFGAESERDYTEFQLKESMAEVERLKDCLRAYQGEVFETQKLFEKTCLELREAVNQRDNAAFECESIRKERDTNFDEATQLKNRFLESASEVEQLKAERDALKAETERMSGIVQRHRESKGHGVLGPICQQRDEALAVNRDLRSEVARLTGIVEVDRHRSRPHSFLKLTEQYYSSPTYVVLREERDNLLAEVQRLEDYNAEISADRTRFLDESAFYHNQVIHLQKDIEKLKQDPLATMVRTGSITQSEAEMQARINQLEAENERLNHHRDEAANLAEQLEAELDAIKDEKWINSGVTTGKVINYLQALEPTVARQLLRAAWSILDLQEAEREAMAVTMEATEGRR